MFKAVLILCAQALIQSASATPLFAEECGYGPGAPFGYGAPLAAPWGIAEGCGAPFAYETAFAAPCGAGYGVASLAASNGAGLMVTSASPIPPTGVYMTSENAYEGPLSVVGSVPFLGAIALEGDLPTVGNGVVTYGCGNGNVAIISEDLAVYSPYATGYAAPLAYDGFGYGPAAYDGFIAPAYAGYGYGGCTGPWF